MTKFKFFKGQEEICWRTAGGFYIPLSQVHTGHIKNIMKCLTGLGQMEIPNPYQGKSNIEWYCIFNKELYKRRNENI